jgi:hypothetical protein
VKRIAPRVVLIFLDGVGIGKRDSRINPFFTAPLKFLRSQLGGSMISTRYPYVDSPGLSVTPLNATLGVAGLPQSGTGQTALFTGINGARVIGKHFGPYPYSTLRPIIEERNIFRLLAGAGRSIRFANAYPKQFFEYIAAGHRRLTVTTIAWMSCGNLLNDANALRRGEAISADITNRRWPAMGYADIAGILPFDAGAKLAGLSRNTDFVLFEYFLTDHAGHSQSMEEACSVLSDVDGLIGGFMESADMKNTLLLITSDHGNLEDLSTRSHTRNAVPLIAAGKGHREFTTRCRSLTDITPAITELLIP